MIRNVRYLILLLTDDCNLHCAYCYRDDGKTKRTMTERTIEAGIGFLASGPVTGHVQLSGGEPTLAPQRIEYAAKTVRRLRPGATLGIQTNGTLIDRSLARLFKKYRFQVGISLDGPMSVHDRLRGEAAATFRGMRLLEEENVPFRVTTVVCRQNADHLDNLVLMLGGFANARGIGLDLLIDKGRAAGSMVATPAEPQQIEKGVGRMVETLKRINGRSAHQLRLRELDTVRAAFRRKREKPFCHAGVGQSLALCPDGSLFPCSQTAGDPEFSLGNVENPAVGGHMKLKKFVLSGEDCLRCPMNGRCPGDCYSRQYYNDDNTRRLACTLYRLLAASSEGCPMLAAHQGENG